MVAGRGRRVRKGGTSGGGKWGNLAGNGKRSRVWRRGMEICGRSKVWGNQQWRWEEMIRGREGVAGRG